MNNYNLFTKILLFIIDLFGNTKNPTTGEYFITHAIILINNLKTPSEKIVALLNEICLSSLLSNNINITGLDNIINELPNDIMEASRILSYDSIPLSDDYINKVKSNYIAKCVLIEDLKLKIANCYNDKTCSKGNHLIEYQATLNILINLN